MNLFDYLDTLAAVAGTETVTAAKRQAGPIQERLPGNLDSLNRWDTLAGRCHGGTAGRLRYGALTQLTAYASSGEIDRQAIVKLFVLAGLDQTGQRWGNDSVAVPVADILAWDRAANEAWAARGNPARR